MAGFQQAANALTGSVGTVGARIGVYNELVGKNKEMIEELSKKNEELDKKNEKLQSFYDTARKRQEFEFQLDKKAEEEEKAKKEATKELRKNNKELNIKRGTMAERKLDVQLAHASKNMMINALYGDFASGSGGGI